MADLGAIARQQGAPWRNNGLMPYQYGRRICIMGPTVYVQRSGISASEGTPSAPSLCLGVAGVFRFRWAVKAGTRTLSVSVKQAANLSPRPRLRIKANPGIGMATDLTADAGAGAGWATMGPITINPTSDGAVWVELENRLEGHYGCFFDHLVFT